MSVILFRDGQFSPCRTTFRMSLIEVCFGRKKTLIELIDIDSHVIKVVRRVVFNF